ncbi:MAG TPA: hypothetical protein VLA14_00770 [Polyangia bacterium]|jgi:hypothetical protein|nr:hypothetical protein [Polyangia bacterium]
MARVTRSADLVLFVAAALTFLMGCQEPVPGQPTYTTDLEPLFEGRCVRCHSADGVDGGTGQDPRSILATDQPASHLNSYADVGDCDPDAAVTGVVCVRGAYFEATLGPMSAYLHTTTSIRMPLAPSEPLTSWELSLVDKWIANGAPE